MAKRQENTVARCHRRVLVRNIGIAPVDEVARVALEKQNKPGATLSRKLGNFIFLTKCKTDLKLLTSLYIEKVVTRQ